MKRICECGKDISHYPNACAIYCDECINRRAEAYASWAIKEITDEELHKILDKYDRRN